MRTAAMAAMMEMARQGKGVFTECCKKATELAVSVLGEDEAKKFVPARLLRKELENSGFTVEKVKEAENGCCRIEIKHSVGKMADTGHKVAKETVGAHARDPESKYDPHQDVLVVATASSHHEDDAVLQAVFAEMKEENTELWSKLQKGGVGVTIASSGPRRTAAAEGEGIGDQPAGRPGGTDTKDAGGQGQQPPARKDRGRR